LNGSIIAVTIHLSVFIRACFFAEAENSMDDAGTRQPGPPAGNGIGMPAGNPENSSGSNFLPAEIARFSRLSSEIMNCLAKIIRETEDAANTLAEIRSSVERKQRELQEVYAIETSAASLKALEEEHRSQAEKFAASMDERRRHWAEEENLRRTEEEEYRENLKRRRQQEQQVYERKIVEERSSLRNKMEEELRRILQEANDKQSAIEEELQNRERALARREEECGRLIGELELFMKRLAVRKGGIYASALSPMNPAPGTKTGSGEWPPGGDSGSSSAPGGRDDCPAAAEYLNSEESTPVISVRRMLLQRAPLGAPRLTGQKSRDVRPLDSKS
jgi:hypothetical protein